MVITKNKIKNFFKKYFKAFVLIIFHIEIGNKNKVLEKEIQEEVKKDIEKIK